MLLVEGRGAPAQLAGNARAFTGDVRGGVVGNLRRCCLLRPSGVIRAVPGGLTTTNVTRLLRPRCHISFGATGVRVRSLGRPLSLLLELLMHLGPVRLSLGRKSFKSLRSRRFDRLMVLLGGCLHRLTLSTDLNSKVSALLGEASRDLVLLITHAASDRCAFPCGPP